MSHLRWVAKLPWGVSHTAVFHGVWSHKLHRLMVVFVFFLILTQGNIY